MDQTEARTIPATVAVCPICGKGLWIESIDEVVQMTNDRWVPACISITCETEPDIDSEDWPEWHKWHFATPYIDWLPIEFKVLDWLEKPEQQERFEAIWTSDEGIATIGVTPEEYQALEKLEQPCTVEQLQAILKDERASLIFSASFHDQEVEVVQEDDRHIDRVMQVALNPKPGEPTSWIDGEPIYSTNTQNSRELGDGEQCPECHSFDTATCLTSPDWWRCSVCLNEWESDRR